MLTEKPSLQVEMSLSFNPWNWLSSLCLNEKKLWKEVLKLANAFERCREKLGTENFGQKCQLCLLLWWAGKKGLKYGEPRPWMKGAKLELVMEWRESGYGLKRIRMDCEARWDQWRTWMVMRSTRYNRSIKCNALNYARSESHRICLTESHCK